LYPARCAWVLLEPAQDCIHTFPSMFMFAEGLMLPGSGARWEGRV
jgi:hypothetical protein